MAFPRKTHRELEDEAAEDEAGNDAEEEEGLLGDERV